MIINNPKNKYRVLIVGSSDIGNSYLHSICTFQDIKQIQVVDPNPKELPLNKYRLEETKTSNLNITFRCNPIAAHCLTGSFRHI